MWWRRGWHWLWAPAADLSQDQVIDMLGRPTEQGKGFTSNKRRTYLRAAYQCAIDVRVTASIPVAFKAHPVRSDPLAQTRTTGWASWAQQTRLLAATCTAQSQYFQRATVGPVVDEVADTPEEKAPNAECVSTLLLGANARLPGKERD